MWERCGAVNNRFAERYEGDFVKKMFILAAMTVASLFLNTGCSVVGSMTVSSSAAYAFAAVCSLLVFAGYLCHVRRKDVWSILMFASIAVVNIGYFCLSVSKTLEGALMANRVAYLGSAVLPLTMIMIILNVCKLKRRRWLNILLCCITVLMFFVAASPGVLDIYYANVELQQHNGATILVKEYGPWHNLYLVYLLGYVAIMVFCIMRANLYKKLTSQTYGFILLAAVLVNFAVWMLEQFVKMEFELLSISYIVSGLFLLSMHVFIQENERKQQQMRDQFEKQLQNLNTDAAQTERDVDTVADTQVVHFAQSLSTLTPKEGEIYHCYLAGMTTKEIMAQLSITENTLKYHNKNLYAKLGVSSRKELERIGRLANQNYEKQKS